MKKEIKYKFAKYQFSGSCFALVELEVEKREDTQSIVIENYKGNGFVSQGYIEEISPNEYHHWKEGARRGIEFGLSQTNESWIVKINKIEGLTTDTNPTIVGYTCLCAFLEAIDVKLNIQEKQSIENFVLNSWNRTTHPFDQVPNFHNLTYENFKK